MLQIALADAEVKLSAWLSPFSSFLHRREWRNLPFQKLQALSHGPWQDGVKIPEEI